MLYVKNLSFSLAVLGVCTQVQAIDLVTNGSTTLSIGGYVKAEGIYYSPDKGDSEFKGSARQSRINLKTTKQVDAKKLTGFIEGDFSASSGLLFLIPIIAVSLYSEGSEFRFFLIFS